MKYHVEKSIQIDASIESVKSQIANFDNWNSWSPWTIIEPDCKMKITGEAGQEGHEMAWNGQVIGSGTNTLIRNDETGFHYDLAFLSPMKSKAKTSLLLESSASGTKVTWTMDSKMPFFLFFMLKMMKNWIGLDYDRGLRMLKEIVEKGEIKATTASKGVRAFEGFSYVGIQRQVAFADLPQEMGKDFDTLIKDIVVTKKKSAKHWVTLYPEMNMKTMMMTYIAAVSDEELGSTDLGPNYVRGRIADGQVLEIKHEGSYEFLGNAWSMGMMNVRAKKLKQVGKPFEYYWNSPKEVAPEELKTSIFFPVKN